MANGPGLLRPLTRPRNDVTFLLAYSTHMGIALEQRVDFRLRLINGYFRLGGVDA